MDERTYETGAPPRPWLAAALSLLVPGLGHLYARRPLWSIAAWVGALASGVGAILGMFVLPGVLSSLALVVLMLVLVALAAHAWQAARRASSEGRLSRRIRWPLLVAALLVASSCQTAFLDLVKGRWARTFILTTETMERTLYEGDYVLADRRTGEFGRGDVITYLSPGEPIELVGRVVAMGGDTVGMVNGLLHVNSSPVVESHAYYSDSTDARFAGMDWQIDYLLESDSLGRASYEPTARSWGPVRVAEGALFVLGDHRNESFDSRHRGPTPVQDVTGRVRRVYFSRRASDGVRWSRLGVWVQ